jgi:flagellar basal body-associated protein FliL
MRTFIILILGCVVLMVALGFYFQWFQVSTSSGPDRTQFEVTVDKEKIRHDVNKLKEQAREAGDSIGKKTEPRPDGVQ